MQLADEKKVKKLEEKFVNTVYFNISSAKFQAAKKLETGSLFSVVGNRNKSAFKKCSRNDGSNKALNDKKLKNKVLQNGTSNNIIYSDISESDGSLKSKSFKAAKLVDLFKYFEEAKPCSKSTNVVKDSHKPTARFDVNIQKKSKGKVDDRNQLTFKSDDSSQFKTIFGVKLRKTARIINGEFLGSVTNKIDLQACDSVNRFGMKLNKGSTVTDGCKNI